MDLPFGENGHATLRNEWKREREREKVQVLIEKTRGENQMEKERETAQGIVQVHHFVAGSAP